MLEILSCNDIIKWNSYIKSFTKWDVYYLWEYADSFRVHGDGMPLLVYYEDSYCRFCYVVMMRDIGDVVSFQGTLDKGKYYDFETPYGYGGPLSDGIIPEQSRKMFQRQLADFCTEKHVISQFVRFHPLLDNQNMLSPLIETRYLRDTVYLDLDSPELIMANINARNRTKIHKAAKSGVSVIQKSIDDYQDFFALYCDTMKRLDAEEYYNFNEDYFASLKRLEKNACLFYAMLDSQSIGGILVLYNKDFMHYHLVATHSDYRNYAANDLLIYEAACWGSRNAIKKFHLGGGMAPDDSLFRFKKQFNRFGRVPFVVGRTIFDREVYSELLQLRERLNPEFNMENNFMIQYRR